MSDFYNSSVKGYGMYDFSNENHEILNDELVKLGVEFEYDPHRNKTVIRTDEPEELVNLLKEKNFKMIKQGYYDDAIENDCVLIIFKNRIESKNLYDWFTKYNEMEPIPNNDDDISPENMYKCAIESGYTRHQIDELMDDFAQGGDEYAKMFKDVLPLTNKLTDFNKKTGIYEMKHLQTFERFYDLNDDIGAAVNPDECCTTCAGSGKLPISNCCGAPCIEETDICSECKEHCECPSDCEDCGGTGI